MSNEPTTTPSKTMGVSLDDLAKRLGIKAEAINEKTTRGVRKSKGNQPNLDLARATIKGNVLDANQLFGKMIKTDTFIKDGKQYTTFKDAQGKQHKEPKLDAQGEIMWNYKHMTLDGYFMIDIRDDGLFDVSRICWYSETFQVGDYKELTPTTTKKEQTTK